MYLIKQEKKHKVYIPQENGKHTEIKIQMFIERAISLSGSFKTEHFCYVHCENKQNEFYLLSDKN